MKTPRALVRLVSALRAIIARAPRVDESQRRSAVEELRVAKERYELAVVGSSEGIFDSDLRGGETFYSRRLNELLGYTEGGLQPTRDAMFALLHPDDADHVTAATSLHLRRRVPLDVQFRLRYTDGAYRWFQARAQAVWAEDGTPLRLAGAIRDITERRKGELELGERVQLSAMSAEVGLVLNRNATLGSMLQASATLIANEINAVLVGIWLFSSDERTLECRAAAGSHETRPRTAERDALGETEIGIVAREREPYVLTEDVGGPVPGDPEWASREGVVAFAGYPLQLEERLVGVLGVYVRDAFSQTAVEGLRMVADAIALGIERKQAEETIRLAKLDLERTNAKLEESLQHARQLAETAQAATRAKSAFLATMSHEIRTPMNGVLGMTGLLLAGDLTPEQRDYAETVKGCGESLLSIISDILDFSKIEAGKLTIEPIPFNLDIAVHEVATLLKNRADEKDVRMFVRFGANVPRRLVGDPGRIRQVLMNLVGNAIKFTGQGHVAVDIECREQREGDARLRIAVTDTGIGVPKHKHHLLFQTFSQADASTTRLFGGTGLGLAISKQLVELMGGEIGVESEEGKGSTFWFELVLPKDTLPPPTPPMPVDLSGVAVLLVDDNEIGRRILSEQLAQWKVRPVWAESGPKALEMLRAAARAGDPIRLAVLDHHMPEMDGEMLGRLVKGDPEIRDTALVLLTSWAEIGAARHFESLGFAAYLVKPVRTTILFEVLTTAWAYETGAVPRRGLITRHSIAEAQNAAVEARREHRPGRVAHTDDAEAGDPIAMGGVAR